jgi:hypothetical protein
MKKKRHPPGKSRDATSKRLTFKGKKRCVFCSHARCCFKNTTVIFLLNNYVESINYESLKNSQKIHKEF